MRIDRHVMRSIAPTDQVNVTILVLEKAITLFRLSIKLLK